ncbi:MAG: 2-phospho-L-lactate guanylyltransferase [Chloroflexi bacterium]|jgi:2-phospho-L-lactate guanylyltransferase|nr:2-phospho-L-lactate guanylyltransferase [Chloroflexota bacterium]
MATWAIVPVKPLSLAKSRLAQVLSDAAREDLVQRMLEHTLQILRGCQPPLEGTVVVSSDARVLSIARQHAAVPLAETGRDGLNAALVQAIHEAERRRAQGILIVPADLPRLSAEALRDVLEQLPAAPGVVVAPDQREEGTNALALRPCGVLEPAFGPGSFRRHCAEGRKRNAHIVVVRSAALALDVDTPEDLEQARDILS